jgi:TonB family protein
MAPIVKEAENPVVTGAPAIPAASVPKTAQEATPTRPQPVALEVPVTVNGARTVEGSDKREPFSESTKTVLVFAHGAVIRLASAVAPGQLLFISNEKTKKEVVCQVVKSKSYRTVTGYVELEFTEPASGFWGMRFPTERVAPAASTPAVAPAAPRPTASIPPAVHVAPKVIATPPAPVAAKPVPQAPAAVKPLVIAPPVVPVAVAKPELSKPGAHVEAHAEVKATPQVPKPVAAAPVELAAPQHPVVAKPVLPPALPTVSAEVTPAVAESPALIEAKPAVPEIAKIETIAPTPNPLTEELKQQTARLQEQLGALLFTDAPAAKDSSPAPAIVSQAEKVSADAALKVLELLQADVKPVPPVVPVRGTKPAPLARKSVPVPMAVEEVRVPSWLAPLARDTEAGAAEAEAKPEAPAISESFTFSVAARDESVSPLAEETSSMPQSVVFGGQLLGGSTAVGAEASTSGSKKGLLLGLAAAGILLIGSGAWYANQPGNALSNFSASNPTSSRAEQNSVAVPSEVAPRTVAPTAASAAGTAEKSSSQPAVGKPVTPTPVAILPANPAPVSTPKETSTAARNTPPVEQPKKPVLGDVHLAAPNVNRSGGSAEGSEAAPSIDANQGSSGEQLVNLAGGHSKEPVAPLPIGGDVKPAQLLKSVPPIYPAAARTQRISGNVQIDALIDASGKVSTMKVISGPALLHEAAMTALKQWKYEPAKLDGNPTPMHLTVTVQFRLQ